MATHALDQRNFLQRMRSFIPVAEAGGVPGPVMIAQAAIESNWGDSGLARLGSAYFGAKARPGWTGPVYSGTTREWVSGHGYVTIAGTDRIYSSYDEAITNGCHPGALFRAYASAEDNIQDYVQFFHRNLRYHVALETYALTRDPRQFARDLARAGYATSPTYAHTLVAFMEQYVADLLPARAKPFTVMLNGLTMPPEAVLVVGGRVYVHVRRLANALGMTVQYDHQTKTVWLRKEGRR